VVGETLQPWCYRWFREKKIERGASSRFGRLSVSHASTRAANCSGRDPHLFHPPCLQPTRFRQRHAPRVMYDEIIPDSEPEREEQRRHQNKERRAKRTRNRQAADPTRSVSFVLSSSPEPDLSTLFNLSFDGRLISTRKDYHHRYRGNPLPTSPMPEVLSVLVVGLLRRTPEQTLTVPQTIRPPR
jgi:hypothetical protein